MCEVLKIWEARESGQNLVANDSVICKNEENCKSQENILDIRKIDITGQMIRTNFQKL